MTEAVALMRIDDPIEGMTEVLRITEVPASERKPFTWDDVRGRMNAGIAERKRASGWVIALRLGLALHVLVMLGRLLVGAFTVGHWVHNAWRERVSLDAVQTEAVRRTH